MSVEMSLHDRELLVSLAKERREAQEQLLVLQERTEQLCEELRESNEQQVLDMERALQRQVRGYRALKLVGAGFALGVMTCLFLNILTNQKINIWR